MEHYDWNDGWQFTPVFDPAIVRPESPELELEEVRLPHTVKTLPYNYCNENDYQKLSGYRREFFAPKEWEGRTVLLTFGAVAHDATVFCNGRRVFHHSCGYTAFTVDLTSALHLGQKNVVAVRCDSREDLNIPPFGGQMDFLTYGGICRAVCLDVKETAYLRDIFIETKAEGGFRIYTATVGETVGCTLQAEIRSPSGSRAFYTGELSLPITGALNSVHPWSIEHPTLYTLTVRLIRPGTGGLPDRVLDEKSCRFGFRTLQFVAGGLYLNGQRVELRGLNRPQSYAYQGYAMPDSIQRLDAQLLKKELGCNAVRTSHNPPAPELLDICDRIGLLVQDEAFDMWRKRKSPYDYARYFDEWHEKDLTDQVLRDRNHPSVFMWSIGNEVLEQWQHADADTLSLEAANLILNAGHPVDDKILSDTAMSVQGLIAHSLAAIVKRLDKTRPVTAANNEATPGNLIFRSNALDVLGFNYHEKNYEPFPQNFPGKTLIVSESTSALMTRGYYQMPSDSMYVWPNTWRERFDRPEHLCSAYDNCHVPWGSTHEVTWREVKRLPYVSGMFIWTGFDYLGEPTPYWWPSRSSFFGIVDLAGIPKDVYYMYQSEWTDTPVLHLFPHWNWKKGETVDVWAYYNQADEVELFLNGESLGVKSKPDDAFHVCWRVPFTPGTLKAVSRKDGKEVLTREIRTAGEPARIMLIPDRSALHADGTDLSFVTVEIQDQDGNLVPDADNLLRFTVEGDGFIAGTDNGDQNDPVSLKKPERHAFYGKAMAVVQNTGKAGTIRLKATAEGLPDAIVEIKVGE